MLLIVGMGSVVLNWRHEGRASGCGMECFILFVLLPVCAILDAIEIGENIHKRNLCHARVLSLSSHVIILNPSSKSYQDLEHGLF
jgi:hypothetical protein